MYKKINEQIKGIDCEVGGWNSGHLWKLKKKISPRETDPPTAMNDTDGNLLTDINDINKEAIKHYKKVLENRPMDENLKHTQKEREDLCMNRLNIAAKNKTSQWTMKDLKTVLKYLKYNKSRDPYGYANEIFKDGVAGENLQLAILKLVNRIKSEQKYPKAMELCNISNLYKNKGPRSSFDSYRGVFRVTVLRSILDRLIYNDMYDTIESNLSDSNVGSRKKRNVRDNLFVLNAILNSTGRKSEEALDVCIYDVMKCFDSQLN